MIDYAAHCFITLKCQCCGFLYDVLVSCGDRLCPVCAARRYGVLLNRYKDFFAGRQAGECRFITLTLINESDLGAMHARLRWCVLKLIEYGKKHWGWLGGVIGYQATNEGKGWHDHAHLIVAGGNYVPQEELSLVWKSITGDSFIVGIRFVLDPLADLGYILGYVLSTSKVWDCFKDEYNKVFKGRRLLQSWGTWFNRMALGEDAAENEFACPNCGALDWISSMSGYDFYLLGARPQFLPVGPSP